MTTGVRLQLLSPEYDKPYQQVAMLEVEGQGYWVDSDIPNSEAIAFDAYEVSVPSDMAANLLAYARNRIKSPYNQSVEMRWCHSFAMEVGATAAESMLAPADMEAPGIERAISIVTTGVSILPEDLEVGEQGVIGNPAAFNGRTKLVSHSLVGLNEGYSIQLDGRMGRLYVGKSNDVFAWYRTPGRGVGGPAQGLYVHRATQLPIHRWRRRRSLAA